MRTAVLVGVVCALGGLAASVALGQGVPVPTPTVTVPAVTVPTVSVPSVTVPSLTPPAPAPATPPVSTPSAQTPPAQTPSVSASAPRVGSSGSGGSGGGASGTAGGGGSGAASGSGGASASGAGGSSGTSTAGGGSRATASSGSRTTSALTVQRGRSTRSWIAVRGPKTRRVATLVFRLPGRARVLVTVRQVSPVCRVVTRFAYGGRAGVNRVRIGGGVHGTQLSPGTYRVTGRTRSGRIVLNVTLVVVTARAPSTAGLASARRSNVCGAAGVPGGAATGGGGAFSAGPGGSRAKEQAAQGSTIVRHQGEANGAKGGAGSTDHGGNPAHAVAAAVSSAAENAKSPVVIALLGLAVLILGLAALPREAVPDPRLNALVVSHRLELALAGTGALAAAVVAMLLG